MYKFNYLNLKYKKILDIFVVIIVFLILLTFIPLNNDYKEFEIESFLVDVNSKSCNFSILSIVNFLQSNEKNFEIIILRNLDIIPKISNLKCLNRSSKVEFDDNIYKIYITKNIRYLDYLFFFIFLIYSYIEKIYQRKNSNLFIQLVFLTLLISEIISVFPKKTFFISISIFILLFQYLKNDSNKNLAFLFFSILIIYNYRFEILNFSFKIEDEVYYLGYTFKSDSSFSSYYRQEALFLFNLFVNTVVFVFGKYFFVFLKLFQAFVFSILIILYGKRFKLTNIGILLLLFIFFKYQSVLAGSWLVTNFTATGLASLSLLFGILLLLNSKFILGNTFILIGFYVHFSTTLVVIPIILFIIFKKLPKKNVLKYAITNFVITVPYLIYLLNINSIKVSQLRTSLEIYIETRHPHHLQPFHSNSGNIIFDLKPDYLYGLKILLFLLITLLIVRVLSYNLERELIDLSIFSIFLVFIYLIILYFYPVSRFAVLFPLKVSSFAVLFSLLSLTSYFERLINNYFSNIFFQFSIILIFLLMPYNFMFQNNIESVYSKNTNFIDLNFDIDSEYELIRNIKNLEKTIPIIHPINSDNSTFYLMIEIATKKPTYVNNKFIPHQLNEVINWSKKLKYVNSFYNGKCSSILEVANFYYIVEKEIGNLNCGNLIYENSKFKILEVVNN